MSSPFQNRLVGTVIVAAAIIIFLPSLLDGEKKTYEADFEAIPQAPAFAKPTEEKYFPEDKITALPQEKISDEIALDALPEDENVKVNTLAKTSNQFQNSAVSEKTVELTPKKNMQRETTSKALPEKAKLNEAWVIHLGSFKNKQNVNNLVAKLKSNGYTVYTKPIQTKSGELTKVFIGPELVKSSLESKLPELKKLTTIQGKVAQFHANE